ncbi:unnamed protein product [Closterium sp. Naga37s-1]|nr:unnamed protein product [Closterium sp. Naga37s-1]
MEMGRLSSTIVWSFEAATHPLVPTLSVSLNQPDVPVPSLATLCTFCFLQACRFVSQRNRFKALLTLLPALSADFLCVQEMDEYEAVYRQPMAAAGWESVYVKRPGKKRDGSGIFFKSSRVGEEVEGDEAEDGESKAGVEAVREGMGGSGGDRGQRGEGRVVVVASSHIFWDPACADVKLAQAQYLLHQVAHFRSSIVTSGHTARAAHGMGPAGVVSASNQAVSSPVSVLTVCSLRSPHPPPALHTPQLLEQRTAWGQQVSSVPTTTLTAHWILFQGLSPLTFPPSFPHPLTPALQLLEQRTSWGQQVSSLLEQRTSWGQQVSSLLEQRTSWGQQVLSVLLAMLAAAVLASLSVLPTASPVYDFVWTRVMPMAVALVLLETDVTSAFTQSGPGLLAFLLGAAGTIAGTLVGFSLAGPSLGVEGWKVAACFCATYIGGSVNYAATAKALGMDITAGAAAASTGASLLTAGMAVDNLLMAAYFSSLTLSIAAAASACALADKLAVHLPPVMASAQLALAAVLASLLSTIGASASVSEAMSAGGGLLAFVATVLMLMVVSNANVGGPATAVSRRPITFPSVSSLLPSPAPPSPPPLPPPPPPPPSSPRPHQLMVASNANVGGPATAAAMASARNWPQLVRPATVLEAFVLSFVELC